MANKLSVINEHPLQLGGPRLLHDLISDSAADEAVAIEYLSSEEDLQRLTYEELRARTDRLSQTLLRLRGALKIRDRFIVPVYIYQSSSLYITQVAILKAGGAFCPIPIDVPEERLRFILEDIDAKIIVTTTDLAPRLPILDGISQFCADDPPVPFPGNEPFINVNPSMPAYVMYTSGSTGLPKGVVISHTAVTQALLAHDTHIPRFSRFLQFANPTFDVSVFEIFFPLFRGATLVCCDRRQLLTDLPGCISRLNIDAAELTPSVVTSLLRGRSSVPTLKVLLTIGEMLRKEVVEEFGGSDHQEGILHGMYGPTEATIHCTIQMDVPESMSVKNIGLPLETVSAFVIKPASELASQREAIEVLPVGEEGELAVGGHQIADGYLNRQDQTRAAFVTHPKYGRIYRTGDRARISSDGRIECLGRISSGQVKLRGQRVELGEVEYAATKAKGCRSAIADIIDGILVVFCVKHDLSLTLQDVKSVCQNWLPAFMLPGDIVLLEEFPYLASGKVDRKQLKAQYTGRVKIAESQAGATDTQTAQIIHCLQDIFQTTIHADTRLIAIGMDSLSAIRFTRALQKCGFPRLDAVAVLNACDARAVAVLIDELKEAKHIRAEKNAFEDLCAKLLAGLSEKLTLTDKGEVQEAYPATALQSALIAETVQNPQAYCNWIEFRIRSSYDQEHLRKVVKNLATHYPLLRSGFTYNDTLGIAYAAITWKSLASDQVRFVSRLDYTFQIHTEEDLLRPCRFQLLRCEDSTHILLQLHHSLYDQWSIDILEANMKSFLDGSELVPQPSFRRLSEFYATEFRSPDRQAHLEFWAKHLKSMTFTPLPSMVSQNLSAAQLRSKWTPLSIDIRAIRQQAKAIGVSVPSLFQAAFACLIGSYTGESEVTFGVVFSGRHIPVRGIDEIFGPCLATLPFRVDCSAVCSITDLVRFVHSQNRTLQQHQHVPPQDIKTAAEMASDMPLFDSLFVWQESTLHRSDESQFVTVINSADHHEFKLVLEIEPLDDRLFARATYQKSFFSAENISLLFAQVSEIAVYLTNNLRSNVTDLMALSLSPALMSISNPSPASCGRGKDLVKAISNHGHKNPSAAAIVFAKSFSENDADYQQISYQELNVAANRLARYLVSRQVKVGDLICICMEKSVDMYISILATIKAGAGYIPFTPETPQARIKSALTQAEVRLCFCDHQSHSFFSNLENVEAILISDLQLSEFAATDLSLHVPESNVLYVIFTSGSTGKPKGVQVTFGNLLGNLQALTELYHVRPGDRLLQACSQAFDVSVFEIFFSFYTGICLCSASKDILYQDLEAGIRLLKITHLSLTPTVASLIDPRNVPTVKFLVTAGEGVTELVRDLWADHGLHQGYGPSETTNICTINMSMSVDDKIRFLGHPLRNTSAFVVSPVAELDILPVGAVGEFAFGGEQIFQGYMGRPDLNSTKLINHPKYGLIYKSGDMGRMLPDGSLLFTGRADDQIKIRGNRVELGEINAVLQLDQDVHDCVTIVTESEVHGQILVSFVVVSGTTKETRDKSCAVSNIDTDLIRRLFGSLAAAIPGYMVPNAIVPITKLPFTRSDKLDKRLLDILYKDLDSHLRDQVSRDNGTGEIQDEWSEDEELVANVLSEVLSIQPRSFTPRTSFFSLGLDSLSAMRFARLCAEALGTQVTVSVILRNPSVARLLSSLAEQRGPSSTRNVSLLVPMPQPVVEEVKRLIVVDSEAIENILPCTPLQAAMLNATTSAPDCTYGNTSLFVVHGNLSRLKQCWEYMIERHAILRTRFMNTTSIDYPFVQVVYKHIKLPWEEQGVNTGEDLEKSSHGNDSGFYPTRSLSHSNPLLIDTYTFGDTLRLALRMHHAIYDGISFNLLLEEIESSYHGETLPSPIPFEPLLAQCQLHAGDESERFWAEQLSGFTPQLLRTDSISSTTGKTTAQALTFTSFVFDSFCKRYDLNSSSIFQAAFTKILSCLLHTKDICFGSVLSGRAVSVPGIERLVAPCFNTVPIRINIDGLYTNIELARQLQDKNNRILEHQLTPLRRIQLQSRLPEWHLFDCILLIQPPQTERDRTLWTLQEESGTMDLPLVFEITPDRDQFSLSIHYRISVDNEMVVRNLADAFIHALSEILEFPSNDARSLNNFDASTITGSLMQTVHDNAEIQINSNASNEDWTATELSVLEVFQQVSGVDAKAITRSTSMYQLGLDSLNAPQIVAKLRLKGLDVDAGDVLEHPSILSLAIALDARTSSVTAEHSEFMDFANFERQHKKLALETLQVNPEAIEAIRPATAVQSGMLAQSLETYGKLYINHVSYQLKDRYPLEQIIESWIAVQQRHPLLRTRFLRSDDIKYPFVMVILTANASELPCNISHDQVSFDAVEEAAREEITATSGSQSWAITLKSNHESDEFTLSMHHALYDAYSLEIMLSDFKQALKTQSIAKSASLDPFLQHAFAKSVDPNGHTANFWAKTLSNAVCHKFPDLNPIRDNDQYMKSRMITSSATLSSLQSFCKEYDTSIQALGQTIWAQVLSAYSGEQDVTFGTALTIRSNMSKDLVFPAITTIPVPCNTSGGLHELLQSMTMFNAAVQKHKFASLSDIQRYAGVTSRLFDTVFVYQKFPCSNGSTDTLILVQETAAVDYTLSLELEHAIEDNIHLRLTFDTGRVPDRQAEFILDQFEYIMNLIVTGNAAKQTFTKETHSISPARVPLLPTAVESLHMFVEQGATDYPHRTALEFVDSIDERHARSRSWTYKELNELANQVANLIRAEGGRQGDIIAVSMAKSPEASFAFIGILKSGCTFLAIDPDLPSQRVDFILEDSRASMLFTDQPGQTNQTSCGTRSIVLTEQDIARHSREFNNDITNFANNTAYCLYTSGTTGTPKGCEITHSNAVQAMLAFQRLFSGHWDQNSRWLQFASYWFDVSVLEQFWSWSVGITVVGAPRDVVLQDLPGFIQRIGITHIDLTPSLARLVTPGEVPSLWNGVFITGGEPLKQDIIDSWGPKAIICNGYGPTEATIGVTMNTFIGSDAKPANIGRQFDNVGAYVLNPASEEPVLRGAVGELCVSGALVGKGYLNRPDLTSRSFPYLQQFGERAYRTGDLVRLLSDDSFHFVGRNDSQTKLRGQRLEVEEIDSVIRHASEDIAEAVTFVIKGPDEKQVLVSFFNRRSFGSSDQCRIDKSERAKKVTSQAREMCSSRLPGYMAPTHIIPLTRLPLTVNNKIDYKRLTTIFTTLSPRELEGLARVVDHHPLNATESTIASVLASLLEIEEQEITRSSNFLSLGLTSISAIQFSNRLTKAGYENASIVSVLKHQTVRNLADHLNDGKAKTSSKYYAIRQAKQRLKAFSQRHKHTVAKELHINVAEIEAIAPCSPLQHGLVSDSLHSVGRPYFNEFVFDAHQLDPTLFRTAIDLLCKQSPILRTCFVVSDNGTVQVVLKHKTIPFKQMKVERENLEQWTFSYRADWLVRNQEHIIEPFQIVFGSSPTSDRVLIQIHHALYDGVSFELMLGILYEIYSTQIAVDCGPSFVESLPFGPLQTVDGEKHFWVTRLEGYSYSPLTQHVGHGANGNDTVAKHALLDIKELEDLRRKLCVSHQSILQACFEVVLSQHYPACQIYGLVTSGRSIDFDGADQVLGPMFNTYPQPVHFAENSTWGAHAQRCHKMNVDVLPYQHTPLRDIRKWTASNISSPMFDVLFVFQNTSAQDRLPVFWKPVPTQPRAEYPLACEIELMPGEQLKVTVVAQRTVMDLDQAQLLLDDLSIAIRCFFESSSSGIDARFKVTQHRAAQGIHCGKGQNNTDDAEHFEWSESADAIRRTMAELSRHKVEDIDESSSIFSLGIDSIDAIKLSSRLRKIGIKVSVSQIIKAQTIPHILRACEDGTAPTSKAISWQTKRYTVRLDQLNNVNAIDPARLERLVAATPGQEALVAVALQSELREYFNHDILHLSPSVDEDRLEQAWKTVIDANPILRTTFIEVFDSDTDLTFAQAIYTAPATIFKDMTLDAFDEVESVMEEIRVEVHSSWQTKAPLRLTILRIKSEKYLLLSLAHSLYDGHSLELLHQDVQCAYYGQLKVRPSCNHAVEIALAASSPDATEFWTGMLEGAYPSKITALSTDMIDRKLHRMEHKCDITTTEARKFCQMQNVSMQSLAQTCWILVLATWTKSLDVVFGAVLACRDSEELEQTMFPTMNTVPIRATLHGTRGEMLQYVQSISTDILPYQNTPLRVIQGASRDVIRRHNHDAINGLFDSIFIYQNRPASEDLPGAKLYKSIHGESSVDYPVAVEIEQAGDELLIRAACRAGAMSLKETKDLLDQLNSVLNSIIEQADGPSIDWTENGVSVCELPSFHPTDPQLEDRDVREVRHAQPTVSLPMKGRSDLSKVLKALSLVSHVNADEITPDTNIERIGIDSISAIKVSSLLLKDGIQLTVSEIIRARTPLAIAKAGSEKSIDANTHQLSAQETIASALGRDVPHLPSLLARYCWSDIESVIPATPGQLYMLKIWHATEGQLFNGTFQYKLKQSLNAQVIRQAWQNLVSQHSILRTAFVATGVASMPLLQVVLKAPRALSQIHATGELVEIAGQPLVALEVLEADAEILLKLKIQHALYDAVSLQLLVDGLERLLAGKMVTNCELKFEDFIANFLPSDVCKKYQTFWTKYLHGAAAPTLVQPTTAASYNTIEIFQPALFTDCSKLELLAREQSISIQAIVFAAYAKVYATIATQGSGPDQHCDVVIGIYLSNRSHINGLDQLAAPTLNLVPLRIHRPRRTSLLDLARQIHLDLQQIGFGPNSGISLAQIAEWTGVEVDTFVNFLKLPDRGDTSADRGGVLEAVEDGKLLPRKGVVERKQRGDFQLPPELQGLRNVKGYRHAIDIEMAITGGNLNVGLFAPEAMLGLEDGERALVHLRCILKEATQELDEQ